MTIKAAFVIICDRCRRSVVVEPDFKGSPTSARLKVNDDGWTRTNEGSRSQDFCPSCSRERATGKIPRIEEMNG